MHLDAGPGPFWSRVGVVPSPGVGERPTPTGRKDAMSTVADRRAGESPRPRLWTRPYVLACLTYVLLGLIFYALMSGMARYAQERFGASEAVGGMVVGAFVLGAVVTRLAASPVMDRLGLRRTLLASLAAFVLATAGYLVAGSLPVLVGLRFVHGMAFGLAGTALATAVQAMIPPSRRSEGTGWFASGLTGASAIGPLLTLQVSATVGWSVLFLGATGITVAALLVGALLRPREPARDGSARPSGRRSLLAPEAVPISVIILVGGMGFGAVLGFVGSYSLELGHGPGAASLFFVAFAACSLAGRGVLGVVHDRRGDNVVMLPVLAGFAGTFLVLAWWQTPVGLAAAGALFGLCYAPVMSAVQTIAVRAVTPARVGLATGTFFVFLDMGTGLGPVVFGALAGAVGLSGMFSIVAGLMALLLPYYWGVHGRRAGAARP